MNFFSIIGKLLGLVPAVTDAVSAIADATRPNGKDTPHPRKHNWRFGLEDPPTCSYCHVTMTKLNANELCKEASV